MTVTALASKWVAGYLKFMRRSDGAVIGGFGSTGVIERGTRVDVDAQDAVLDAATLSAGLLVHTSTSAGGTLTVDTGENLDDAFPDWQVGEVRTCFYLNDGTQTVTLTGDTGSTALVAQTIATLQGRRIRFLKNGDADYSVWAD